MTSDDHGLGRAIAARKKNVAELRRKEPEILIETRWCPSRCEIEGDEKADEWGKAGSRRTRLPWRGVAPILGSVRTKAHAPEIDRPPQVRVLGSEVDRGPRHSWSEPRTASAGPAISRAGPKCGSPRGSTSSRRGTPSRAIYLQWTTPRPDVKCWWVPVQDPGLRTPLQELPAVEELAEDPLGDRPGGNQEAHRPSPGQRSHQNSRTLRDERCSRAVLDSQTSARRQAYRWQR